jgi:hypothetical protein
VKRTRRKYVVQYNDTQIATNGRVELTRKPLGQKDRKSGMLATYGRSCRSQQISVENCPERYDVRISVAKIHLRGVVQLCK